ncbi:MAG: hypothetical protein J0I21_21340 [Alphaproteobacteria bacterium]|nr:hypothetical protein [Alphaproteobacteria bacterium]
MADGRSGPLRIVIPGVMFGAGGCTVASGRPAATSSFGTSICEPTSISIARIERVRGPLQPQAECVGHLQRAEVAEQAEEVR